MIGRLRTASAAGPPTGWHPELGVVAVGYRWAIVISSLTVAFLSGVEFPISARFAVIGPILMSIVVSAITYRDPGSRFLWPVLFLDIIVGTACVLLTGGVESPFLFYLSVPLVRSAVHAWIAPLSAGSVLALLALVVIHVVDHAGPTTLLVALNELAVILAAPWLVLAILSRLRRDGGFVRSAGTEARDWRGQMSSDDVELIALLKTGATHAQIAESMSLSAEAVKVRVAKLYRRLGARNRTEALAGADGLGVHRTPPETEQE